jgi:murein DD-endopeptidase MepM/ murein hydrolase activator NlpD
MMTAIGMRLFLTVSICGSFLLGAALPVQASTSSQPNKPVVENKSMKVIFNERKDLFDKISTVTGIPWYMLAAVDQYERTIQMTRKNFKSSDGLIAVNFTELQWCGLLNPNPADMNESSIALFNGLGKDGSGDGKADRSDDLDKLYAIASYLLKQGSGEEDLRIGLWEYYQNTRSVERIEQFASVYARFETLDLFEHTFVMPLGSDYSYRSTWGASRGWGGYRIHEGTDLFAGYGVPVRSAAYGMIEIMGWNPYGGWRVGIRDLNNVYHYYAHLSGFNKEVKEGDIVKPGQIIGWVGSSGYGKPGTSGKFPSHLHYGLYRDNGLTDWSFDPYPHLRKWEREERLRKQK